MGWYDSFHIWVVGLGWVQIILGWLILDLAPFGFILLDWTNLLIGLG